MKILVINGPNINMLGTREPEVYGSGTYRELLAFIEKCADELDVQVECFQSNCEGEIVTAIQNSLQIFDGIVINPAAYTHTSIAILDALKAVGLPAVEVHISDVSKRESFRRISYAGMACLKTYAGLGFEGYRQALIFLKDRGDRVGP
ncbi:MAG: type II 3-dehydroquinate dehydratase [Clostridia bacterium]|nr:type II 3-dehydroquinate dehydratase [Clostridia bacterium]